MQQKLNVELIRKRLEAHPRLTAALELLAKRQRGRREITLRRLWRLLREGGTQQWSKDELKVLFEVLQEGGAGRVVFSDKTTPRFLFDFYLPSVARAVLGLPEPARTRKDGTPIEQPDGVRRPTPPRKSPLPKPDEHAAAATPPVFPQAKRGIVELRKPGIEVKVDLDLMTPEDCRWLTKLLLPAHAS